jgi:hypothetical protein
VATKRDEKNELPVFQPEHPREAAQGWALHATRRRRIHEDEARHQNRLRYWLGGPSAGLAAVASTLAAWHSTTDNETVAVFAAGTALCAAVLAAVLTILDPGGQSEAHRRAATAYKSFLRDYEEEVGSLGCSGGPFNQDVLRSMKRTLDEADKSAPTLPKGRAEKVEEKGFKFVGKARDLPPN